MIERPMCCARLLDPAKLRFPVLATPKVDGIRALTVGGQALTRSFKLIQNLHIRTHLETLPDGCDGELVAGNFNQTTSAVMRRSGKPDFEYWVFDFVPHVSWLSVPYSRRSYALSAVDWPTWVRVLTAWEIRDVAEFYRYEEACLEKGHEGVVVRSPDGPYKFGRSTPSEGYLWKFKRVQDSEARVVGFDEQRQNCNPIERNVWGYARRPGGAANKVPKGTLGSLKCVDIHTGVEVDIGTGLSAEERQHVWDNQGEYLGRVLRYKYQECGRVDRPRFPKFDAWVDHEISAATVGTDEGPSGSPGVQGH